MEKTTKSFWGEHIEINSEDIVGANTLHVEVGTNGFQGGDYGHGCTTYLSITNGGGTEIVDIDLLRSKHSLVHDGFEIILGGDSELYTLIEALKFATNILEEAKGEFNYGNQKIQ